ncbi:hypothetical protein SprV_0501877100 [Sparganum proliferum]
MAQPDPSRWSDHLPLVMLSLSSTLKADIGCTAADLVYGTSLRLPDVVIDRNGKTDTVSIDRVKPVYIDDSDHSSPQHCTPPQTVRPPQPTGDSPSPIRRTRSGSHVHWPDRQSAEQQAQVARESACYKVDIAVFSETRLSKQGQLKELGAGYISFWSGHPKAERPDAAFTLVVRNDIVG